jgi:uncharacterized protein with HEPN domain
VAEALCRLREHDSRVFHEITDADVVVRLRTAILHNYDDIDYGILWRSTRQELPRLIAEVEAILKRPV